MQIRLKTTWNHFWPLNRYREGVVLSDQATNARVSCVISSMNQWPTMDRNRKQKMETCLGPSRSRACLSHPPTRARARHAASLGHAGLQAMRAYRLCLAYRLACCMGWVWFFFLPGLFWLGSSPILNFFMNQIKVLHLNIFRAQQDHSMFRLGCLE